MEEFSKYFENAINDIDLYEFSSYTMENSIDEIDSLILKFKSQLSILKIKQKFSFKEISVDDIKTIIRNVPTNKATERRDPIAGLEQCRF